MRTPPTTPRIIRLSVSIYRSLIRGFGPTTYFWEYGDSTVQLFRECCQDAYSQRGIPGVLALWFPSFRDAVIQMALEVVCERQDTSQPRVSVGTVASALALEYFSAPIGNVRHFIQHLTRPLIRKKMELRKNVEQELWLRYPANMHFEEGLRHWGPPDYPRALKRGVVTSDLQGRSSAFLRASHAPNVGVITLRQTIKADDYRGKQLRFSGEIKTERLERHGGLYIRTDVFRWKHIQEQFRVEQPGDPSNRPDESIPQQLVQGTHDWMRCEATVPVAEDALFIRFGLVLYGRGQIWLRDAQLEVVEQ